MMEPADDLIERIVRQARIAGSGRRAEVARELRAHLEDLAAAAAEAGRSPAEIRQLMVARFGDPAEIAGGFAHVYRWERALLQCAAFLLSTLAAAAMISVVVSAVQAGVILGLGLSAPGAFSPQHLALEAAYLLATAAAYLGLVSLEPLFARRRFGKALAVVGGAALAASAALWATVGHSEVVLLAAFSGAVVRALHLSFPGLVLRVGAVVAVFGAVGLLAASQQPAGSLLPKLAVWVAVGLACQAMTSLSARLDRVFLKGIRAA